MTDHLPSKEQLTISEIISELKLDLGDADAGPWEIYTSNSYRRVGLAGTYKAVVYPVVHNDGQPDIAGFANLRAMVESFNAAPRLIAEIDRLRTTLTGIASCSTCEACRGAAVLALGGEATQAFESFVVKHYSEDERPTIKGNGFDGLEIGRDRQEAEEFISWINIRLSPKDLARAKELLSKIEAWHSRAAQPPGAGQ